MRFLPLAIFLALASPLVAAEGEKDWSEHKGKLNFVIGWEKGQAESKFTGKPMMAFITTTW